MTNQFEALKQEALKKREGFARFGAGTDVFPEQAPLVVRRRYGDAVETLQPLSGEALKEALMQTVSPLAITSDPIADNVSIVYQSGYTSVQDELYDTRADGVYDFRQLPYIAERRMVCRPGDTASLLQMTGQLWQWGNEFDCFPDDKVPYFLTKERLTGRCGKIAEGTRRLADSFGINARKITVCTTDIWHGQDDRHRLLELQQGDQWVLYDPTTNSCFGTPGQPENASLLDLWQEGLASMEVKPMPGETPPGKFEVVQQGGFNYALWTYETCGKDIGVRKEWYRHVMQVPMVHDLADPSLAFYPEEAVQPGDRDRFNTIGKPLSNEAFANCHRSGLRL